MLAIRTNFRRLRRDKRGATAIEYGLIAAGISLAIIAVVNGLGTTLNTKFTSINTAIHMAATLPIMMVGSFMLGYFLNLKLPGHRVFRVILFIPALISLANLALAIAVCVESFTAAG